VAWLGSPVALFTLEPSSWSRSLRSRAPGAPAGSGCGRPSAAPWHGRAARPRSSRWRRLVAVTVSAMRG